MPLKVSQIASEVYPQTGAHGAPGLYRLYLSGNQPTQGPPMQDPQPDFHPITGIPEDIAPGLRRILAPNPSPMTYRGTNTYLLGTSDIAVIDPGPSDMTHLDAILAALRPGQRVGCILVTHAHLDHAPLARPLADRTGAPVLAFGRAEDGRSQTMQRLATSGLVGGGEGIDPTFEPDRKLRHGDETEGTGWRITALHTPGHMANHLGFSWNGSLFSGDLVMGWASSLVSPPDGDLAAFMASLRRLSQSKWHSFYPGHGAPVMRPNERLAELLAHRQARGAEITERLRNGPATAKRLTSLIYTETPAALLPAAERNVLAHLIEMVDTSQAQVIGELSASATFSLL